MPQRQVRDAKKFGVEFKFGITAEKLIAEDGYIRGVAGREADGKPFKASAKMVVDSSGSSSVLRKFNPINSYIDKEIDIEDMEATGRYLMEFDQGVQDETYFTPEYCLIHLDQDIAPAGYAWVFPKGKNKVNIGLGVSKPGLDRRNRRLKKNDNLSTLIDQYVKENPSIRNGRLSTNPDDKGNEKGNWHAPVRRQNDCMVANGFVVVGDAAWMPRPLDAGGMGPRDVRQHDPRQGRLKGPRGQRRLPRGPVGVQRRVHAHPRVPDGLVRRSSGATSRQSRTSRSTMA